MYDNYVFDLYGTLADIRTNEWSEELWKKMAEFFAENGAAYEEKDDLFGVYTKLTDAETEKVHKRHPDYEYIDIKVEKVFRQIYEMKGVTPSDKLLEETGFYFRRTSREYIRLYPGIRELLDDLKKHGRVFLLTNAQRSFTWDELEILDIVKDFDGILISSDEECSKPDIHFFKALEKLYSLDPKKTIMIGNDPRTDIKGGIAAGWDTLYIHSNISPEIDYNTGCTYFIPDGDTFKMKDYLI